MPGIPLVVWVVLSPLVTPSGAGPPAAEPVAVVTAVQTDTLYLMATGDARALVAGAELRIIRAGKALATIVVQEGEPLHADAALLPGAEPAAIGDRCYALGAAPLAVEAAAPSQTPVPPIPAEPGRADGSENGVVAVVSAVEGSVIYLTPVGQPAPGSGSRLVVHRGGVDLALLTVRPTEPYSADLVGIRPGIQVRIGDSCRLALGGADLPPPTPGEPSPLPEYVPPGQRDRRPQSPRGGPPLGPSILGPTGIIRMPSAEIQRPGMGAFAVTHVPGDLNKSVPGNRDQEQYVLGVFPRLELGNTLAEYFGGYDITAHGKIQLLREGDLQPALAVGAAELGRNELVGGADANVIFGAASKHLLDDRIRITLGYATRGLTGFYGGVEYGPDRHITLLGEYDTRRFNYGVRINPTDRAQLTAALGEGGWDLQFGYGWATMPRPAPAPDVAIARPATAPADWEPVLRDLQQAVVALGLENVQAGLRRAGDHCAATIEYENRRYSHNELEALGRLLAVAVSSLPASASQVDVVIRKLDLPIATCSIDAGQYTAFMSGDIGSREFARHISLTNGRAAMAGERVASTAKAARSRGRVDLTLHPDLRTRIGTEEVHVATGWSLEPELDTSLARGLALQVKSHFPVAGPLQSQDAGRPFDLATAAQALWLGDDILARGQVGRFPDRLDGFYGEAAYLPSSGRHLITLSGGGLRHRYGSSATRWDTTVIGGYRYSLPEHDLLLGLRFGRYLYGDWGLAGSIRRDLGDTILTAELAHSELGGRAALWVEVPLGSGVDARPGAFRPRISGYGEHGFLTGAGATEDVDLVDLIAREADIGASLLQDMLNRDRLSEAYLRTHLENLKRAGGRAVGRLAPRSTSPTTE